MIWQSKPAQSSTSLGLDRGPIFDTGQLGELLEELTGPAVSLFMPTVKKGPEVRQNAIRFRTLLELAKSRIEERDDGDEEFDWQAMEELVDDRDWWEHQEEGFACFLSPGRRHVYRTPIPLDESVVVGRQFHVLPLLPLIQGNGRFFILAASLNGCRLFEATRDDVAEVEVDRLGDDVPKALRIDEYRESLQNHPGPHDAGFHGHGGAASDVRKQDEIYQFFRVVAHRIDDALPSSPSVPLVYAGVESSFPLFRRACQYPGLVAECVPGNPEAVEPEALHRDAWTLVAPRFTEDLRASVREALTHHARADEPATATGLERLVRAAQEGAIEILLIARGREEWGLIDDCRGLLRRGESDEPGCEEIHNYLAARSLRTGANVFSVAPDSIPDGEGALAVLRYPVSSTDD